jgi:hypothetical protein
MYTIQPSRQQLLQDRTDVWKLLTPQAKADIRAGRVPNYPDQPWIDREYKRWCLACNMLGPRTGSVRTGRVALYKKRKRAVDSLPKDWRDKPPDALYAAGFKWQAEALLDVNWQLGLLRKGRLPRVDDHDWETTQDRFRLRRRLHKYETRLSNAGGRWAGTTIADALVHIVDGIEQRIKYLEHEEYYARLREWQHDNPNARPRPRRSIPYAERLTRRGGTRGARPGCTPTESTKPRRPHWLVELERQEHIAAQRARPIKLKPVPKDWHAAELDRKAAVAARQQARVQAHHAARVEHQMRTLTEWAWGDGRLCGAGVLVDGWIYYDTCWVPYATQRAAALARCAVAVQGGFCFPPVGQATAPAPAQGTIDTGA